MKRNLLAGLILSLAVPATAFAADATHSARAKKHSVVAQAGTTSGAKSDLDAAAKKTKKKGKAAKAKTSDTAKKAADKAPQVK